MPINTQSTFSYDKLDHTKENSGHLMVTLDTPERDFQRTPLSAVLVLDVSGSMSTPMHGDNKSKISGLKEVARCIVQQLASQDELAIVTFSSTSEVIQQRIKISDKNSLYAAIDRLATMDSTNMGSGLIAGLQQINRDFTGTRRIFLVSDGRTNAGMSAADILSLVQNRDTYGKGIVVSTFGLGRDVDQELLADLAKLGNGNYYFIKDTADIKDTFARELGGALACDVQNIEVKIKPNDGNEIVRVLNDFTVVESNGTATINAEDLYVGEKRHILVELKVPKVAHPKPRKVSLAHVEISYYDVKEQRSFTEDHNILVQFVKPEEADTEEKLSVKEQVAILNIAEVQIKAANLADMGNFAGARALYEAGAQIIREAATAGSVLCSAAMPDVMSNVNQWDAANYSMNFGATARSDASNLRKMRGAVGMSARLYSTRSTESMKSLFESGSTAEPYIPAAPATPVQPVPPVTSVSVTPVSDVTPVQPVEVKKTFAKKRSGKRG